jgi:hypothetical protein
LLVLLQDNDVKWASNDFKGKISHHGAGKPFKDGFSATKPAKEAAKDGEEPKQEAQEVSNLRRIAGYRWLFRMGCAAAHWASRCCLKL